MSLKKETKSDLDGVQVVDAESFLEWLPLAARLAALGDDAALRRWPELRNACDLDMDSLLRRRADEGIWDIDHAEEIHLYRSLVCAQDFYFFLKMEEDLLSPASKSALTAWAEVASDTCGDAACVDFLSIWRDRLGDVPEEWLLAPVAAPMTEFEVALTQPPVMPAAPCRCRWKRRQ